MTTFNDPYQNYQISNLQIGDIVELEARGGGGGGGNSQIEYTKEIACGNQHVGSGGGGGGQAGDYIKDTFTVSQNGIMTIKIGKGGMGSIPENGGNTIIDHPDYYLNLNGGLKGENGSVLQGGNGGGGANGATFDIIAENGINNGGGGGGFSPLKPEPGLCFNIDSQSAGNGDMNNKNGGLGGGGSGGGIGGGAGGKIYMNGSNADLYGYGGGGSGAIFISSTCSISENRLFGGNGSDGYVTLNIISPSIFRKAFLCENIIFNHTEVISITWISKDGILREACINRSLCYITSTIPFNQIGIYKVIVKTYLRTYNYEIEVKSLELCRTKKYILIKSCCPVYINKKKINVYKNNIYRYKMSSGKINISNGIECISLNL